MNCPSTIRIIRRHAGGMVMLLLGLPSSGRAASLSAAGGFDYYQGPVSLTRGVVAAVGVDVPNATLALGGVRYDDQQTGAGTSGIVTGAVRVHPVVALSAQVTRFVGDEGFRAWRVKLGPQLLLAGSRTLLAYSRDQEDAGAVTQSGVIESEFPLLARWKGHASGSYATAGPGLHGMQGAVGLGWSPLSRLELTGQLGLAQQAAVTSYGPGPRSLVPLLPSKNSQSTSATDFSPTALVSIRISAP